MTAVPLVAYDFRVTIGITEVGFQDVTGLQRQNTVVTYEDGLSFREGSRVAVLPSVGWTTVTMRRGTVAGMSSLLDWLAEGSVRRVSVGLFATTLGGSGASSREAVRWVAERAVPVRLEAPPFDATTNEVAIETLEISATDIRVEYL